MRYRIYAGLAGLLLTLLLTACAGPGRENRPAGTEPSQEAGGLVTAEPEETAGPSEMESPAAGETSAPPAPQETAEAQPSLPPEGQGTDILRPSTWEDIQGELRAAISGVRQPAPMDVSGMTPEETWDIDIRNLYYQLTRQDPQLKYAYDISVTEEGGTLLCQVSYMPYKTESWPEAQNALTVSTMGELLRAAEDHIGADPLPIRLTDPSLAPDDLNRVLQQAGGGYILCALNRDGTAITYTPAMGMEMEECLALLEQAGQLAEQIAAQETDSSMTEREKAEALYTYLISHVKYDHRYNSDRVNMPYDAQTAIGALRDNLAICGGYSHALQLLFEQAGIPCFNMTGKYFGQNHMWSIARLDGEWLWFDATSDRGLSPQFGLRHFALEELDPTQYQWEPGDVELLLRAEDARLQLGQ